ncbi:MAG TPA: PBP1A family penicillin-binding protein [Bradyrhizobium sp.]|nr:PBP1A family penicillin-binding protein [Bradyrhizobium sp.]
MAETPTELQTGVNKDAREQGGSVDGASGRRGGQSLRAGTEFLKAVGSDLAALASWLGLWLITKYQFLKAATGDLAVLASRFRLWLIAKQQSLKAAASGLAARAARGPGGRSLRAGGVLLKAVASDLAVLASRLGLWLIARYQSLRAAASNYPARAARAFDNPSLRAGGAFLNAVAGDLAVLASRLRLSLFAKWQRMRPSFASAPSRISSDRDAGRGFQRLGIALSGIVVCVLVLSGTLVWTFRDFPLEPRKSDADAPGMLLEAANGEPLGRIGPIKVADAARQDFPEHLVQAVLSMEDRHFYGHFGIDLEGIFRAMRRNAAAGEVVEGGSTITQQLAKLQYVGNERTFSRKLREALTAMWLELRLGKDEILTRYLNTVYLGAGAYGMPGAARLYFDKSVKELTLSEAAMLAGLIRAPSLYNPLRDPEKARQRISVVLDAMVASGAINAQVAAKAKPAEVRLTRDASRAGSWFGEWVKKELADATGSLSRSIRVRTTLVPGLQKLAEEVIQEVLAREGERSGATQAALVAMRPDGTVLAMVGGRNYSESQFNRAVEGNRQPGSTFKLFVYLAALRNGFAPEDVIDAGPIEINGWEPENFDGRTYGRMTLAEAFAQSVNTAAVRLAMEVGLDEVIAAARDLGIEASLPKVPSLALGTAEVSLLEMTGAFASVRAGMRIKPSGVMAIGADDQLPLRVWSSPTGKAQPLGAYRDQMIDLLRLVIERGTGRAAALPGFAAGKTGTSQNHRDAWFVGFNKSLVVGVWVGNDDSTPMQKVVGGSLPATIWHHFVSRATGLVGNERVAVAKAPSDAVQSGSSGAAPPAQCNYRACASTYRSFRTSDCTYQAYGGGPRRVCDLETGSVDQLLQSSRASNDTRSEVRDTRLAGREDQGPELATNARGPQCNIPVCARFYRSFDPSDCTYQPYFGGPRRICER